MKIDPGIVFAVIFLGFLMLTAANVLMWHILHIFLCKKFDDQLFQEPHFRINELAVYSSWPLSLFRSMGYILLLGVPVLAKKRRFIGVNLDRSKIKTLIIFSRLFIFIGLLDGLFFLGLIIMGIFSYLPGAGQSG